MNLTVSALGELEIPIPPRNKLDILVAALDAAERAHVAGGEVAARRHDIVRNIIVQMMDDKYSESGVSI